MEKNRSYLHPETVSKLASIDLKARLVVEGFITGLHKSPYHGFSVEFAEHRQYMPGDEIKFIDWKIYGRTDRHYVKRFEDETNLRCTIVVDTSGSMAYASEGNISKFEYASYLAAALAYLMTKQSDAVGLALFDTEVRTYLPSRAKTSYVHEILRTLQAAKPAHLTSTSKALEAVAEKISRRGLVVIISDFFDDIDTLLPALKRFRYSKHEVIVIQVVDPRELDFQFGSDATFHDLETDEEMVTQPFQIREAYQKAVTAHTERLKMECRLRNIDYFLVDTSQPFDVALTQYLMKRQKIQG